MMVFFHAIKMKHWKRWSVVVVFALFTAFFLWSEQSGLFSQDKPVALTRGDVNDEKIALTFNISWGDEKVYDILAALKKEEVQATFFLSGEWAERHPQIIEEIVEGKHEIGMLGYRYKSYLDQEIGQVRKDLLYAQEIFRKLGYEDIKLLRPPSGHFNKEVIDLAKELDFEVIHWTVNPNDWDNPGTDKIIDSVLSETSNGAILLMHASDSAKQTAKALETILPGLKNKGFDFISISELKNNASTEIKEVE